MLEFLLFFIVVLIAVCLLVSVFDCNRIKTVRYDMQSEKITKPCTLVLLSDLHNKTFGKENEKLIQKIDGISPDGILVAGDMLTATKGKDFSTAITLMEKLSRRYRIYYGMGNHEYRLGLYPKQYGDMYERYMKGLDKAGIVPLINESAYLPDVNISVYGLQIDRKYYKRFQRQFMSQDYIRKLLRDGPEDAYRILIAHNPQYFEEYAAWGADLVVSGHIHGGIMKLPVLGGVLSPNLTLFPKYDGGRYEIGKSTMILSRGLGTHTIPLRIFNPGELVVIRLQPTNG